MISGIKDEFETIQTIISDRASIARFGDGELRVCRGGKIKSQAYSRELWKRLNEVLTEDLPNLIVGIPRISDMPEHPSIPTHWKKYTGRKFTKVLNKDKQYYSSFISRRESAPWIDCDEYWNLCKRIWDGRDVIAVQGDHRQFANCYEASGLLDNTSSIVEYIGPGREAFGEYDKILSDLKSFSNNKLILMCLGATATVLAYDLTKAGYQALDLGRLPMHHRRSLEDRGLL